MRIAFTLPIMRQYAGSGFEKRIMPPYIDWNNNGTIDPVDIGISHVTRSSGGNAGDDASGGDSPSNGPSDGGSSGGGCGCLTVAGVIVGIIVICAIFLH